MKTGTSSTTSQPKTQAKKRAKGSKPPKPSAVARRQRNLALNEYGSDLTGRVARKDRNVARSSKGVYMSREDLKAKRRTREPHPRTDRMGPVPAKPRHKLAWDRPQPRYPADTLYSFEMQCKGRKDQV